MASAIYFNFTCSLPALLAFATINQDWHYAIPLLGIVYRPWRLYMILCSLPALIACIALIFLPESPRFVLEQGDEAKAIETVRTINRWNNGTRSPLDMPGIRIEPETHEHRKRILACQQSRFPLITSIWNQTAPLFQASYLKLTLVICCMQFIIYYTCNGWAQRIWAKKKNS